MCGCASVVGGRMDHDLVSAANFCQQLQGILPFSTGLTVNPCSTKAIKRQWEPIPYAHNQGIIASEQGSEERPARAQSCFSVLVGKGVQITPESFQLVRRMPMATR